MYLIEKERLNYFATIRYLKRIYKIPFKDESQGLKRTTQKFYTTLDARFAPLPEYRSEILTLQREIVAKWQGNAFSCKLNSFAN